MKDLGPWEAVFDIPVKGDAIGGCIVVVVVISGLFSTFAVTSAGRGFPLDAS